MQSSEPVIVAHLVEIRREQQEGGERRGADGVALRERLGRVADRVEPVGLVANVLRLLRHLDDAAGIVGDRAEDVHREDVAGGAKHAHRRDRGAEQPAVAASPSIMMPLARPSDEARDERDDDRDHRQHGGLHAHRESGDDVGRRSRLDASAIVCTGR